MSKIEFWVVERENRFRKKGKEHALYCRIGNGSPFSLQEYENKPSGKEIEQAKSIARMAMEFYHYSIKWPTFSIEE